MSIGERIRKRRHQLGMTQMQLAEKLGLTSKAAISTVENDKEKLTTDRLKKYAAALKTTTSFLLGDTDDPEMIVVNSRDTFQNIDQYKTFFAAATSKQEETIETGNISDGEYQMLRIIYYALTPRNRTRIVGIMQEMLMTQQKGGRDDD